MLVACIAWFVPYLTRERENVAGVPVPTPFVAQAHVVMRPGAEACLSDVAFDTDAEVVEVTALTVPRSRPTLKILAEAPGYRETATVPGGGERIDLLGTTDSRTAVGRPITRVDGAEVAPDLSVRLLSTDTGSVLERLGQLIDRAAAFKPGLFGAPIFLWVVALLLALGAPALAVYSLVSSFRGSD